LSPLAVFARIKESSEHHQPVLRLHKTHLLIPSLQAKYHDCLVFIWVFVGVLIDVSKKTKRKKKQTNKQTKNKWQILLMRLSLLKINYRNVCTHSIGTTNMSTNYYHVGNTGISTIYVTCPFNVSTH